MVFTEDTKKMDIAELVRGLQKLKPAAWEALLGVSRGMPLAVEALRLADDIYRGCFALQCPSMFLEAGKMEPEGIDLETRTLSRGHRCVVRLPSGDEGEPKQLESAKWDFRQLHHALLLVFHARAIPSDCEKQRMNAVAEDPEQSCRVAMAFESFCSLMEVLSAAQMASHASDRQVDEQLCMNPLSLREEMASDSASGLLIHPMLLMEGAKHSFEGETDCEVWKKCTSELH